LIDKRENLLGQKEISAESEIAAPGVNKNLARRVERRGESLERLRVFHIPGSLRGRPRASGNLINQQIEKQAPG